MGRLGVCFGWDDPCSISSLLFQSEWSLYPQNAFVVLNVSQQSAAARQMYPSNVRMAESQPRCAMGTLQVELVPSPIG